MTKVTFDASTAYEWDVGSAPDIAFVMLAGATAKASTVISNSYTARWDYTPTRNDVVPAGTAFSIKFTDVDPIVDDEVGEMTGVLPTDSSKGTFEMKSDIAKATAVWSCVTVT
jgi:hypothetical protein